MAIQDDVRPGDIYDLRVSDEVAPRTAEVAKVYPDGKVGMISPMDDWVFLCDPGHPVTQPFVFVEFSSPTHTPEAFQKMYDEYGFNNPEFIAKMRDYSEDTDFKAIQSKV